MNKWLRDHYLVILMPVEIRRNSDAVILMLFRN